MGRRKTWAEKTNTEKDRKRQTLRDDVYRLMTRRRNIRVPPPLPTEVIHFSASTPEVRAAMRTLHESGMFNENTQCVKMEKESLIDIESWGYTGVNRIKLRFDQPVLGCFSYWLPMPLSRIPTPIVEKLRPWAHEWWRFNNEANQLKEAVTQLCDLCGTFGQIARVWPQLTGFFPGEARSTMAKKQPRLPDGITVEGKLIEKWTPEALRVWDEPLAEALLLQDVDAPCKMELI